MVHRGYASAPTMRNAKSSWNHTSWPCSRYCRVSVRPMGSSRVPLHHSDSIAVATLFHETSRLVGRSVGDGDSSSIGNRDVFGRANSGTSTLKFRSVTLPLISANEVSPTRVDSLCVCLSTPSPGPALDILSLTNVPSMNLLHLLFRSSVYRLSTVSDSL
jgi:hypothetical protein